MSGYGNSLSNGWDEPDEDREARLDEAEQTAHLVQECDDAGVYYSKIHERFIDKLLCASDRTELLRIAKAEQEEDSE